MDNIIKFEEEDTDKIRDSHGIWAEKYRPQTLEEFIGSDVVKQAAKAGIESGKIPHMILKGPPGVGKTTLAKLLVKLISCDYLYVNASSENRVDMVREKIMEFVSSTSFKPLKIVLLDEADRLTSEAQSALKNIMEEYSANSRFIMTTNYAGKLEAPIISRCQVFEIEKLQKTKLAGRIANILKKESIKFSPEDVVSIVNSYYPDLRKMLIFSQQCSITGTLVIPEDVSGIGGAMNKLVEMLRDATSVNDFADIRQMVANANFSSYDEVYKYLYEHVSEFSGGKDVEVIMELAESVYQSSLVFEKEIMFVAAILKILKIVCN